MTLVRRIFHTFAAMKATKKQRIASWVLLAVFVPILVFSSVHIHPGSVSTEMECSECVAHHCHGHIGQADVALGDCLLCQFLTLSYITAALAAITVFFNVLWILRSTLPCVAYHGEQSSIITRGPPAR